MKKTTKLRELLATPGPLLSPGVYDCLTAKIVEASGMPMAAISAAGVSASVLGYPDVGLQTMHDILNQARNIANAVDIPVTVDADTGYGNALNVMRTTREFEAAGVAGMMIEDQVSPKRCGQLEGKKVITTEEMVTKIKAACDSRRDDDFVIIGRTDSRATHGIEHAIERSLAYVEAGADVIFIDAMVSREDMIMAAANIPVPLKTNVVEGGKTPVLTYDELHELGFKVIGWATLLERAAIRAGLDMMELVKREGNAKSAFPDRILDIVQLNEFKGLNEFYELEEQLYGGILETEGSWREALRKTSAENAAPRRLAI